jgi:hypothetical protein
MDSKKNKLLIIGICIALILLIFSVTQYALTFRCPSGCDYCGCQAHHAIVWQECCGICYDAENHEAFECCDLCPYLPFQQ